MKKGLRIILTLFLLLSILPVSSLAGEPDTGTGFEVTAVWDGNDCNAEVQVPAGAEDCQPLVALYEPNGKLIAVKYAVKSQETSGAGTYQAPFPNAPENATVRAFLLSADKSPMSGVAPATAKYLTVGDAQRVSEGVYRLTGGTYQNVTIPESIGNGDVTLNGVTITGKLIVLGGGANSVHLDGCSVDAIQVNKDSSAAEAEQPRIELKNTPVEKIEAVQPVTIETDGEASAIQEVEAKSNVTVQGAATKVEKVTVPNLPDQAAVNGVKLTIEGANVAEVAAEKPVTIEAKNGASPIGKVEAKDDLTVMGDAAQIAQIEVPSTATKQPVIDVQAGTVSEVKADKPAEVKGSGTVTNVEANAEVKVASETVTTITVTVQVTVTVTGNSDVEVAVAAPVSVSIDAGDGSTVAVSTTVETGVNVTLNNTKVEHIHKWEETSRISATCSAEGSVTYTCIGEGACDKDGTKTETLAKLAHTEEIDDAVAATCTADGLTAGKHCSVCGEVLIEQQTVPATGHSFASAWSCDETDHWHAATCGHDAVEGKAPHVWDGGTVTTPAEGTQDGVKTYTCTVCGAVRTESIPSVPASVSTVDELAAAMQDETLSCVVLAADIEISEGILPAGKTLIVPEGKTLTVTGILNVYGTLVNEGTICNKSFLDVFGTLKNSGEIAGDRDEEADEGYASSLGIEGGATLTNSGSINDCVVVADYYYGGEGGNRICTLPNGLEIAEKIAVAFGAEQTKRCLALDGYDVVVPVGEVDLGDVTIPAGKLLRVKDSVFDGQKTYGNNSVTVRNLTAEGGIIPYGGVEVLPGGSLTVTGSLTLATSSVDYQMDDTGYIRVMAGGSLTVGGVQYIGENGALTLDVGSLLVLNGLPQDVATVEKPTGIFALLLGNAAVEEEMTFTVPAAWDNFIIPQDCTLTVRGTLTNNSHIENRGNLDVYGKLINHGTIDNQNTVYVFGGTLENRGRIEGNRQTDENGFDFWQSIIGIENGGRIEGSFEDASIHDYIEAVDSWYDDKTVKCSWDAAFDPVADDFEVMAVAFGTDRIQAALNAMSYRGNETEQYSAHTYEAVIACGTDTVGADESTVNTVQLGGITVNPYQRLRLGNWIAGSDLYRNDYVIGEGETLTLREGAGLECYNDGSRTLTIDGEIVNNGGYIDFGRMTVAGKNAPIFVHNEEELAAALEQGGTVYLEFFEELVQENEWERRVTLENPVTVGRDTELVNHFGSVLAIPGLTVSEGAALTVSGMTVVLAANSSVSGTIETHDGQVVVQGKDGTTLTINEGGRIVVGQPNEWGALAIYAAEGVHNRIVNNGTIESFGGLFFDRDPENGQFEGNEPLEYANLRDLVCELYHRFDGYPNMESVDYETTDEYGIEDLHWVYAYPDGGSRMYNEDNPDDSDYDALGAFSWFIKNGVIPEYNAETNPELRPYELITGEQAAELMNRLGKRISGATGETYSDLSGNGYLCRTDNISVENEEWKTSELRQAVDGLENRFASLHRVEVKTEEELVDALNAPYVTEIRVTGNDVTLNGAYYRDGQFVSATRPEDQDDYNDGPSVYFFPAGENQDQWREIIVEPGAVLTVAQGVKLDIQRDVKLRVEYDDNNTPDNGDDDRWGNLTVLGSINVFGELEPDENDADRIAVYEDAWIAYFGNSYWFSGALQNTAGTYMTKTLDDDMLESYREMDGWDDDPDFTVLVAYGLTPESDGQGHSWWNAGRTLTYGEMRTILTNVYREAYHDAEAVLPGSVTVGDESWPHDDDLLSNRDLEELLEKFSAVLPKENADVFNFVLECKNCEPQESDCDGGRHELVNGSHDNNVRNLHFTEVVTISNATNLPDNDNWGGAIRFAGCCFDKDITVIYNPGYNFRVEFDASCEFADGAKVNVVKAEDADSADLLANNNVTVRFDCAGGKVVSSARVDAQAADGVSYIFNGVTVEGSGTETDNNSDFFLASMFFNCAAEHTNDFDWGSNDHSQCSGAVSSEYQFTAYGNTEMTVSGTTNENLPIHLAGSVDISGLAALENQEITLHNWNGGCINVEIGSNSVAVYDMCDNACVNGVNLSPHVFGRNRDGLFIGLQGAETVPAFTLEQWRWDDTQGDVLQTVEFTTEYFDAADTRYTGEEQNFDIAQMTKVHLYPTDGGFDDPSRLVLTVDFGGGSVTFNGIWWKPVQIGEFVDALNETLSLTGDNLLTLDKLSLTDLNGYDYLTYGSTKAILTTAWTAMGKETDDLHFHMIIDDNDYWEQLNWWQDDPDRNDNPDNWTRTWGDAEYLIRRFRSALGMNSVEVTDAQVLLDALAEGYTEIQVTGNITVDFGDADEYCPHNVYLNRADGVDEQVICVQPGVTFTVGGTNGSDDRVKMDIQDGVRIVLCTDENNAENHGVLCVNSGSCVNVFGGLDTPPDDDTYVVRVGDANVSYMKRIAELGGRLYERLREIDRVEELTDDALSAHAGEDCWPDDEWNRQGMAFLEAYAGLTPRQDGDHSRWSSWDYARYGELMELLGAVYTKLTGVNMPVSVNLDWTPDNDHILDDYGVDTLIDRFVTALPRQEDSTTTSFTVTRNNVETITGKTFTQHITVTCDPQYLCEGDSFGGDINFVNCEFKQGVTVKMTGGVGYNVRLNNNCTGSFTVTADDNVERDRTGVSFFGMNGVTINGLYISGNVVNTQDDDFNVNVRYDREGEDGYIPTLEIVNLTEETVALTTGSYEGKLRVAGWLDVSGVTLGENSRIELSDQYDCDMALGSNDIFVNSDCGCCYNFTGTAGSKVIVCDQNQNAQITVNDVDLGTPHIFGEHGEAIFFPLKNTTGISFKVEQRGWDEEHDCDVWTELGYAVDQQTDKLHITGMNDQEWITNPNEVRVTVTVDGCSVVYDTLMWKGE